MADTENPKLKGDGFLESTRKKIKSLDIEARYNDETLLLKIHPPGWFTGDINELVIFPEENGYFNHSSRPIVEKKEEYYNVMIKFDNFRIGNPERFAALLVNKDGWHKENKGSTIRIDIPIIY